MSIIIPFIYIIFIVFSSKIIFKKSFAILIPFVLLIMSFITMFCGLAGYLQIGIYIPLLIIPIAIYIFIKKGYRFNTLINYKDVITLSLFILLFIYICIYQRGAIFDHHDDFSHWGPMVKGMVNYNKLYCDLDINNGHPEYPPLLQCFEYMWCYLAGGFTEASVLRALNIFTLSLAFPIINYFKEKNTKEFIIKTCVFLVTVVLLPFVKYIGLFSCADCIYVDMTIAIASAITVFISIEFNHNDLFESIFLCTLLSSLYLIKNIGLAFYLMSIFCIIVFHYIYEKKKLLKYIVLYVLIPVSLIFIWQLKIKNLPSQFDLTNINILDALKIIFLNTGESGYIQVKDSYFQALFEKQILYNPFSFNFIICALLLFAIFFIVVYFTKKSKREKILLNIIYLLSILGYIATLLILYLTCFPLSESSILASFERYFGIFICFSLAFIGFIICGISNKKMSLVYIVLLIALVNTNVYRLVKPKDNTPNPKVVTMLNQLDSINPKKTDKIVVFHYENLEAFLQPRLKYLEVPIGSVFLFNQDKEKVFSSVEDLTNIYKNADYVYIYSSGNELYKVWKQTNNDDLLNDRLYKVENGTLKIIPWKNEIN